MSMGTDVEAEHDSSKLHLKRNGSSGTGGIGSIGNIGSTGGVGGAGVDEAIAITIATRAPAWQRAHAQAMMKHLA
jgi:hypothetical protein